MVAAKHGHVAVVELLLLAGADYFLRNKVGAPL
jgi:ankyrin repeat protein